jgi:putative transcriptional regulator
MIIIPSSRNLREQDGVLYLAGGIPVMTMNTLRDHLIEEIPPMVYYNSGGHFVALDGNRMRDTRESMGISLGSLSKSIGVSRRAIQMYESGMGVDLETALRIEEILRSNLVLPLDPFSRSEELEGIRDSMSVDEGDCRDVVDHLGSLGMEVIRTSKCPFDVLARRDRDLLMASIGAEERSLRDAGTVLSSLTMVTGNESFLVATGPVRGRSIGGTPVLSVKDVKGTDDIDELLDLIRKRRKR